MHGKEGEVGRTKDAVGNAKSGTEIAVRLATFAWTVFMTVKNRLVPGQGRAGQ